MKRGSIVVASLAGALALWGGAVLSQGPVIAPQIRPNLGPGTFAKLFQAGKLRELTLARQVQFTTLTDLNGKLFAAAPKTVAALDEQGQVTRRYAVDIDRISISPHATNQLLLGDGARKTLLTLDTQTGRTTELLRLSAVTDPDNNTEPSSELLKTGELASVASTGKEVFVAMESGYSSAIFKIDPQTRRVVGRGWAPGADMSAMTFFQNGLYVLTGYGSQVARYTDRLEKTLDKITLPTTGVKGLALRATELNVLTDNVSRISKYQVDRGVTDGARIRLNVDIVRNQNFVPVKFNWGTLVVKRYAVLICGDLAENFAGECFWNDTVWMYKALLNNGYKPENIFVLYGDGVDYLSANPRYRYPGTVTDFPATKGWVNKVFDGLKNGDAANSLPKMDGNDTLFVWTFDHGGGGMNATLSLRGGGITDTEFATHLNAIPYASRAIFMQQCHSGGFIDNLQNSKTVISTACRFDQSAYPTDTENENFGGKVYNHGEYNYYIISALDRQTVTGSFVNADKNSNNLISAWEMHDWDRTHESSTETPVINDGGPGNTFNFKK
ncbi:MAG: C13 family peptidase [Armatimonas sp.]